MSAIRAAYQDDGAQYYPYNTRLETWEDPTPGSSTSTQTLEEMTAACIAATRLRNSLRPKSPTRADLWRRKQERERKTLVSALNAYAKQNNMQPDELEFVEVKGRTQILERSTEYLHFNFLVKQMDGISKLFFAEINAYCRGEKDVYLCTPLEQSDYGPCFGCRDRDLKHPTSGAYLAGRTYPHYCCEEIDSDDDDYM
ncbi:hypothetical protein CFC21_073090 [Triticum aestivum]|uniref:DUF3615 domain-containing protein n=2 Tax=Triticum aestivum TaxID=4565 RepID=A0A9R1HLZ5_WHEAT|nr:uncharacterized protein LOC123116783 [Triticum aestivum]KAF7067171.1 hypothetical protein CFC21_073090 [Triticum aestivum]